MDEMIASHIRRKHNMMIGEMTSERVKLAIGSAVAPQGEGKIIAVKGRDLVNGSQSAVSVSEAEIADALTVPVGQIVGAVRAALERAAPAHAPDQIAAGTHLQIGSGVGRSRRGQ